jgi:hypothetical protein
MIGLVLLVLVSIVVPVVEIRRIGDMKLEITIFSLHS